MSFMPVVSSEEQSKQNNINMDNKNSSQEEAESSVGNSNSNSDESGTSQQLSLKGKLRVLCLHGYRQNGEAFRSKLGSFRKQVGKYADFVFTDAPHKAAPLVPGEEVPEGQLSWWFNKEDRTFKGTNKDGPAYGFEESIRHVEQVWQEHGPFHGLLGFSQGACFAALICGLAQRKLTSIRPQFAVIAAGFKSESLAHKSAYEELIPIPALHIYGTSDEIIPMNLSEALMEHFSMINVIEHSGGHYFPATAATKHDVVQFFQDRLIEVLEEQELSKPGNVDIVNDTDSD